MKKGKINKKIKDNEKLSLNLQKEINDTEKKLDKLNAKKIEVENQEKDILKKKRIRTKYKRNG